MNIRVHPKQLLLGASDQIRRVNLICQIKDPIVHSGSVEIRLGIVIKQILMC